MQHVSLSIFDHNKKKVCELYDSDFPIQGQAYDIVYSEEIKLGWKELSFTLPFSADKQKNFRWDYIKNDYLVRLINGDIVEWFKLTAPKKTKNGKALTNVIKCNHISANLKTKNLYLVLDDENGIGTAEYLINKVLVNTGWTLGNCDTFYEKDGETEKVRSISSKGKRGTYQLISDICDIFNAYPVYYGDPDDPKVDIRALENKLPIGELYIGKNLDSISKEHNSDNLVTRLYVEGQYSDNGYVGIDNASDNPTKLPFLLNFDYYKSTGQLTAAQEEAISQYEHDYYENNLLLMAQMRIILDAEDILNVAWGQPTYVLYQLERGSVVPNKTIYGGNVQDEDKDIHPNDKLLVFEATGDYREEQVSPSGYVQFTWSDRYALKFITLPAGKIGARQVAIESKEKMIRSTQEKLDNLFEIIRQPANRYAQIGDTVTFDVEANGSVETYEWQQKLYGQSTWTAIGNNRDELSVELTTPLINSQYRCILTNEDGMSATSNSAILFQGTGDNVDNPEEDTSQKRQYYNDLIDNYEDMIDKIYNGTDEATGQYDAMRAALDVVLQLDADRKTLAEQQAQQDEIEAEFAAAMGDLLRDGYWANTNYAPGQENELYYDALSYLSQTSKPKVKYSIALIRLPEQMGFTEDVPLLNSKLRIWDEEMKLNDIAYVSKRTLYLDDPRKGSIEISNEEIASAISKTLDDVFEKMTQLADLVNQRNSIYERARIINENGTLPTENLVGTISIQEHIIESPQSLWRTDDTGALIFESPDGQSAFKLDGSGIQIAYDQFEGDWDWQDLMDGYGIDASYLSGGYVSGDLIEEGSIDFTRFNDNFRTQYYQDERQITLTAQETGKNGEILRQAGIYLTASGKIEYAEDNELNLKSVINQSASEVRTDLYAADSRLGSYIDQTATAIEQVVYSTDSRLSSAILQNESQIALRVKNGDVATQQTVECGNVSIENGNLNVAGYVTASGLKTAIADISTVDVNRLAVVDQFGNEVTTVTAGGVEGTSIYGTYYYLNGGFDPSSGTTSWKQMNDGVYTIAANSGSTLPAGKIGFKVTKFDGNTYDVNFNIADTQYFIDTLSAFEDSFGDCGWTSNNDLYIDASLDTTNKRQTVNSARVNVTLPGDETATSYSLTFSNLDLSTELDNYLDTVVYDSETGWDNQGKNTITLTNGNTFDMYINPSVSASYDSNDIQYDITVTIGNYTYTTSISASDAYYAGQGSVEAFDADYLKVQYSYNDAENPGWTNYQELPTEGWFSLGRNDNMLVRAEYKGNTNNTEYGISGAS